MRRSLLISSIQRKTLISRQQSNIIIGTLIPFICIAIALTNFGSCIHAASLEPQFINESERDNQPLIDEDNYPMVESSLESDSATNVRVVKGIRLYLLSFIYPLNLINVCF